METKKAKVFIVDDYLPMRQSLRKLLEMETDLQVCGEATDVEAAYQGIQTTQPDVAIVDLILGSQTGLELLKKLNGQLQILPVLILSMLPEALNAETVLNKGARGYIMKSESPDHILAALRQVLKGEIYLSPEMALKLNPRGQTHE
jgi:DNA-binding NarL/FixJ family response regulator